MDRLVDSCLFTVCVHIDIGTIVLTNSMVFGHNGHYEL